MYCPKKGWAQETSRKNKEPQEKNEKKYWNNPETAQIEDSVTLKAIISRLFFGALKLTKFIQRYFKTKFEGSNFFRILFHQGSCKDKFKKVVSWFSLRQDASETLLKKWGHRSIFWKKRSGKVWKIHVLLWRSGIMAQIIRVFSFFEVGRINSSSS